MPLEQRVQSARGHLGGYIVGGDIHSWCEPVWDWLVRTYAPRSLLDLGCGEGHSTAYFHNRGVRVLGLDGMPEAIRDSRVPGRILLHDFCAGAFQCSERFDLLWSCEFLEHIRESDLPGVLETVRLADTLAITHALPGQPGYHHVNCQSNTYWIEVLEGCGFICDVRATVSARVLMLRHPECGYFFGRSGLVFRRHPAAISAAPDYAAIVPRGHRPGGKARLKRLAIRVGIRSCLILGGRLAKPVTVGN